MDGGEAVEGLVDRVEADEGTVAVAEDEEVD